MRSPTKYGLAVSIAAILVFACVATLAVTGATQRADDVVLLWLNSHATRRLDVAALEVTALGSTVVIWTTVIVTSVLLWASRHRYSAAMIWAAMIGGSIINSVLKMIFERPRPELFAWRTDLVGHSSFPSGHATSVMVVYATLAYLVARLEPSRGMRRFTFGFAVAVILLVGLSRLYLGVHYPSDVLGGFAVGLAWTACCAMGIEAVRHFRGRS